MKSYLTNFLNPTLCLVALCFLVPTAEAVVTTLIAKTEKKKEQKISAEEKEVTVERVKVPFSRKLKWLNYLLLGGAVLLAFEHLWHGEIVPYFPFLTAASNAEDMSTMFHEMSTVGVTMALVVTGVWGVMCLVVDAMAKKENEARSLQKGAPR